ncbi:ATP-binding protein [Arcicella lustrica]|uniref:ATP-binding protein n=1 Tax=Arcicella lustrica TaxID=2984196 RepID=A0ABU5SQR4_9BACT|nr:ATP-binding protein [Arcicella sp. DC25W]MEA5429249.1 ATP-binding protein [Arcicella sp. DC25W]
MLRSLYKDLINWKNSTNRKPLILQGARQVGKTWLMKNFGKAEFENTIYLNFESSERLKNIFLVDFDIKRIIATIEIEVGYKIHADKCLIIFDEIQEAGKGLTALKYFYEQAPAYYIIAAGSLLGVSLQKNTSFPVGKVDFMRMYPMSFVEFLENTGQQLLLEQLEAENWSVIDTFHDKLVDLLRLYYFVGGMPEAVSNYIQFQDLYQVREIQNKILLGYENDFAKHAPIETVPRIRLVWSHLISQLAKENRKFIYGQIKKGSRAKDFETAIRWLTDAGLVLKVNIVEKPTIPLSAYADIDIFKLFCLDVGLLNAMAGISPKILLEKNSILTEFKGALTEQFVAQQLKLKHEIYYWSAQNATAEIDFMIQKENTIIPIEVKAEENLKSKSLKVFVDKFQTQQNIRFSMNNHRVQDWMINTPLYAVNNL